jgi:hypothetical protein
MTAYPIGQLIEWGVKLHRFNHQDYCYDAQLDLVFIRVPSKLSTWIELKKP